ncbi:MAG TPA: S1C family serine protease [Acetobacteraceae bacterium]|nr:S1C family serine protease [Acetobacteraceae bacterium]
MSEDRDWEIPPELQPDPEDYPFDLDRALESVVGLSATVPPDAFTAATLGTERVGSGVVIREDGLVLTIGYLITEAEEVWLRSMSGQRTPGHALAYDQETGFGLVQALGRLALPTLPLGRSDMLRVGDASVVASGGGRPHAIATKIVARQEFAGYWEYLLDDAIFTAPAHPFWGGAALIGSEGKLAGIGSLLVQRGDAQGRRLDINMCVPIDHLTPILNDLLTYGRVNKPSRPWLGVFAAEQEEGLVVVGLAKGGPADKAGVQVGDRIVAVGEEESSDLSTLWQNVWSAGTAGAEVRLRLMRDSITTTVAIRSGDRAQFLRSPTLH